MIPILFDSTETTFTSNGIGRLADCTRCLVTEERNGQYECEFDYPITGRHYSDIEEGRIVFCTHDDLKVPQPFVIYRRTAPIDGLVTFNARHLSYKLSTVIVNPFSAANISDALAGLSTNSINTNPFTFSTQRSTIAPFAVTAPASVRSLLGGVEGSLLDVYGGEWEFDKWTVTLHAHRGNDSGVSIRYGKNLSDLQQVVDASGLYNAVVPYWEQEVDGQTVLVMLPERIVAATGVTDPVPVVMDLSMEFAEQPTEAQLRAYAQDYLATHEPWMPAENLTVDFVHLKDTTDYASVANLQRVNLCDTVDVYYPALGVTAHNIEVIKTVYNVLSERYDSIELGQPQTTFGQALQADLTKQVEQAQSAMQTIMDAAIQQATDLIAGGRGGHLVIGRNADGEPEELLIMDTDNILTATNIIRMNLSGIGFSTNGGQSYSTAWTINGAFVADFITSGTLRAIMIQGPTADTFWNLSTGVFQSYGVRTLSATITAAGGAQTVVTYDTAEKTKIDAGVVTVTGKKTTDPDTAETVFSDLGVRASDGIRKRYAAGYPSDLSDTTYAYPHGGIVSRGYRVTAYGGQGDTSRENRVTAEYNPRSILTPDLLELGEAENPTYSSGSYNAPDRNILQLNGGWVNKEDSVLFYRHATTYQYYDPDTQTWSDRLRFQQNPEPSRVAWDLSPGDTVEFTGVYCMGVLGNNKLEIMFQLPLVRPISPDAQFIHIDGTIHARQGSTVICNQDIFDSYIDTGAHYFSKIEASVAGLSLKLHHYTGSPSSWSTGTLYAPVFITLNNVTLSILYEDENQGNPA